MSFYLWQKILKITNQIIQINHFPLCSPIIVAKTFRLSKLSCLHYYQLNQVINKPKIHPPIDHFNSIYFNQNFFLVLHDQMIILE